MRGTTINDINSIDIAIQMYYIDTGIYPSTEQGLDTLLPPTPTSKSSYLNSITDSIDPWGKRYRYRLLDNLPQIDSAGPDGQFDTTDDITKDSKLYRKRFGCTYTE